MRVLVAHGQWERRGTLATHQDLPVDGIERALRDGLIHYVALGDRHSRTIYLDGRAAHSGTHEATAPDEVDPGWVLLVGLDGAGRTQLEPIRIGRWSLVHRHHHLTSSADILQLETWLASFGDPARTVVQLDLDGSLPLSECLDLEARLARAGASLASLRIDPSGVVPLTDAADPADVGLSGAATTAFELLAAETTATSRAALQLLVRLAREGQR